MSIVVALGLVAALSSCAPAAPSGGAGTGAGTEGNAAEGTVKLEGELPEACDAANPVLGVSLPDTTNPYYVAMQKGFLEEGKANGFDVKMAIADDDDATQLTQIESFIQQKVCAVAINGVSSGPPAAMVKKLNDAGIPVFSMNVLISQPDLEKQGAEVLQFVGADQVQGGTLSAQQALGDLGSTTMIAGIIGFPDSVTTNQRDDGFIAELGDQGEVKSTVNGKVDPNISLQVTNDLLQGNPDINVVFGDTGPATLGAVQAVKQLGKSDSVSVYGFCAADTPLEAPYMGCVAQEPYDYAKITVENVKDYLAGEEIQRTILRPLVAFVAGETPGEGLVG